MAYVLYCAPDNASLIVRMVLHEMNLAHESHWVNRSDKEQSSQAYLRLNPQGLIPVLLSEDLHEPLFETGAILLWLAQKHRALWPQQAGDVGAALKWLFYLSNTLHADLRVLFYTERYVPQPSQVPMLRQGMRKRVIAHFSLLEREIAEKGGPWLLGSELTVVDYYLAMCARWARLYPRAEPLPQDTFASLPHVTRLLTLLEARPAVQRALALEGLMQADGKSLSAPLPAVAQMASILGHKEV